ncbi:MAG: tRNA epoxyqueuosine(34) reductase QueG [Chloroflexota bacterium]
MSISVQNIKAKAHELGFNLVGLTRAESSPHLNAYLRWVDNGMHGNMGYLAREDRLARRHDLNVILPDVQTLILVGMDYRAHVSEDLLADLSRGRIASYAWNVDYHDLMTPRLEQFGAWLAAEYKVYVDTGAILERSHAQQAGMGFIGKNTMLINPRRGSYFFLGEILTTLEPDAYDSPHRETMCGNCVRCLHACPTDAFPQPYVLDARRCISYHTIENKGYINHELRGQFGNWVYGCDVCQDVCPWQRFTHTTSETDFNPPTLEHAAPPLLDLLQLTTETFKARYRHSPIYRIKRARLVRNACIAAGNWRSPEAAPHLRHLLIDESPLVRAHAAWALLQIEGERAHDSLTAAILRETDPDAKTDMAISQEQSARD